MVEVRNQSRNHPVGHIIRLLVVPLESEVVVDAQPKQRDHRLHQMSMLARADIDSLECVRSSFEFVNHGCELDCFRPCAEYDHDFAALLHISA